MGCWNIRGFNMNLKQVEVKDLIKRYNLGLMGLVDTRVRKENVDKVMNNYSTGWLMEANYEKHELGKIWLCWDPRQCAVQVLHKELQAIHAMVCLNNGKSFLISVIYASTANYVRRELWGRLVELSYTTHEPWIVLGDFNSIINSQEKVGGVPVRPFHFMDLLQCVTNAGLFDLRYSGHTLTWTNKQDDRICSKLDRVLCNTEWLGEYMDCEAQFLNPGAISDHTPMVITSVHQKTQKKKTFRFYNLWVEEEGFQEVVANAWATPVVGNPMFVMMRKLKHTKNALIEWNKERVGNVVSRAKSTKEEMDTIQTSIQADPINQELVTKEREVIKQYVQAAKAEEAFYKQKSREMSINLGDNNTKYFFRSVQARRASNRITCLKNQAGHILDDEIEVGQACVDYYQDIYNPETLPAMDFKVYEGIEPIHYISDELAERVQADTSRDEIIEVLASIKNDKSPGNDGFTSYFFKAGWSIVGNDFVKAVMNFFKSSRILREVNTTCITLVPKVDNPTSLGEYRPIACCGVLYKCITKILTRRMKMFIPLVVSQNQSAFIAGRYIQDNILLSQELLHNYHRNMKPSRCAVKVDLKKAYDTVRWEAIIFALQRVGVPYKFLNWVKQCIETPMYSIMVNGAPHGYFGSKRGIRQGDPMSPYLFVMVMELLSDLMKRKVMEGKYMLHSRCNKPVITHLAFADDLMAFMKGDTITARGLKEVLTEFKISTGLEANPTKSQLFFSGVSDATKKEITEVLQFSQGTLPVKYLGLPLITTRLTHMDCQPLLQKVAAKAHTRKGKYLSYAGRKQLIKSVMDSLSLFWCTAFVLPKRTIEDIRRIERNFLWTGPDCTTSHALIKYEELTYPYEEGGIALRDIEKVNQVANLRHIWHLVSGKETLWTAWMQVHHIKKANFWALKIPANCSWSWRNILKGREEAKHIVKHIIGNGEKTSLWDDPWHHRGILSNFFTPELQYSSMCNKFVKVSKLIQENTWHIPAQLRRAMPDITVAIEEEIEISGENDEIVWTASLHGDFTFKDTYHCIRNGVAPVAWHSLVWFSHNIPRHSFIAWMLLKEGLKTLVKLKQWNVVQSEVCILCSQHREDENHLFHECQYAACVWNQLINLAGYNRVRAQRWEDELVWFIIHSKGEECKALALKLIFNAGIYGLWKERNTRIFQNKRTAPVALAQEAHNAVKIKLHSLNNTMEQGPERQRFEQLWNVRVSTRQSEVTKCKWSVPKEGEYTINTDGTLQGEVGGWAAAIRNSQGEVIHAAKGRSQFNSIGLIELQGVEKGLHLAISNNITRVSIQTDSTNVIAIMKDHEKCPWKAKHILKRILRMMEACQTCIITHVYRECNKLADALARNIPTSSYVIIIPSSFSEDVKKIVYDDAIGKEYVRM